MFPCADFLTDRKMKKQSPLTNIPTNPRTISGQWMTFSHMANHYRKLVNVKPRVDTGLTRSSSSSLLSLHQSPKRSRSKLSLHRPGFYSSTETMMTENQHHCCPRSPAKRHKFNAGSSSRAGTAAPKCSRNDSFHHAEDASECSENCQMMYRPVNMKSSREALNSETGANLEQILSEPHLKTISIGEKIRRFLNHIHSQEKNATKPKLVKRSSNPSVPGPSRPLPARSQRSQMRIEESPISTAPEDRHSCCYTSYTVSRRTSRLSEQMSPPTKERATDRPSRRISKGSSSAPCQTAMTSAKPPTRSSIKSAPPPQPQKSDENYVAFQGLLAAFGNRRTPSITKPLSQRASLINPSNAKKFAKPSFASPQSIGTIHGSDDLLEEPDDEQNLRQQPSTSRQFREDIPDCINNNSCSATASPWVQDKISKTNIPNTDCFISPRSSNQPSCSPSASSSNTSNTSVPKSSKSSSSRAPSGSHVPNKDSSRDSAYGFSSGDSRITTRESTPEKRSRIRSQSSSEPLRSRSSSTSATVVRPNNTMKYKSTLSTVASSVNQEDHNNSSISQLESLSDSGDSLPREGYREATHKNTVNMSTSSRIDSRSKFISAKKSSSSSDKLEDSRYVQFLTAVTDDIVNRGVYTNKGIKNVFKFHMANHADLSNDKMIALLEQLRMDMGVPKEDSLDRLEFGYGSVKYSSGPYFRRGSLETPPSSSPNSPGSSTSSGSNPGLRTTKKGENKSCDSRKPSVVSIPDRETMQRKSSVVENLNYNEETASMFEHDSELFQDHNHFLI